ncbi:MAG: amidohydrolase family protein [Candidatus Hodarchaeota archaeon]
MINNSYKNLPTIDIHTHFPLSSVTSFIPDAKDLPPLESYLKALDDARVAEAVLLCGPKKESMVQENELLAERFSVLKHRFLFVAWLNPKFDSAEDLQALVEIRNFRGLKLHPVLNQYSLIDVVTKPLIEKAVELGIPVLIHSGWGPEGKVQDIGKLAEDYPDATFVCCHMKEEFGLNDRFSHIEIAYRHTNVLLECSYIPHPRRLAEAVDIVGAEKILFGSDYPWGARNISWEKTKVTQAPISLEAKKKILAENARCLFKL